MFYLWQYICFRERSNEHRFIQGHAKPWQTRCLEGSKPFKRNVPHAIQDTMHISVWGSYFTITKNKQNLQRL